VVGVKLMKISCYHLKRLDSTRMLTILKSVEFVKLKHIKLVQTTVKNVRIKKVYVLCVEQKS